MKRFLFAALIVLLILGAGIFFVSQHQAAPGLLWESSENSVSAKVEMRQDVAGQWEFIATFTPTLEHFHLYSKDLPKDELNGLGRPTLLELISPPGAIRLTGPLKAYQPTHDLNFESLGLIFPVYPEGAVTLGLPFAFTGADGADSVELSVTYMACSDQTCLAPVIDRRFTVNIPRNP